jgi:hypothetical protein
VHPFFLHSPGAQTAVVARALINGDNSKKAATAITGMSEATKKTIRSLDMIPPGP